MVLISTKYFVKLVLVLVLKYFYAVLVASLREISSVNETIHLTPILAVVFVLLGNAVTQ